MDTDRLGGGLTSVYTFGSVLVILDRVWWSLPVYCDLSIRYSLPVTKYGLSNPLKKFVLFSIDDSVH